MSPPFPSPPLAPMLAQAVERARVLERIGAGRGLVVAALLALLAPAARADVLRIGVLDYQGSEHSIAHWQATGAALNAALPGHHFELVALDIHALDAALDAGGLDFVITNPGNYAELEYHHHISRIATAEDDMPVASTLVTTEALSSYDDLAGRRLAVVAPEAFGGFQVLWRELSDHDPRLPGRIAPLVTGYPMQAAAQAVLDGKADAAVLRACLLEELQAADPAHWARLHAFATRTLPDVSCAVSSRVYPGWPFAKTRHTDAALSKQVAIALLGMSAGNLWTVPLDYQPVHDLPMPAPARSA